MRCVTPISHDWDVPGVSGVSAKAMQKLARHSTVELTIGRYTHANLDDLGAAVRQMATLPLSETSNPKISTDETIKSDSDLVALMVAGFGDNHCQSLKTIDDSAPRTTEDLLPNANSRNPQSTRTFDEDCGCLMAVDEAEREGFEPSVPLRTHWFSRPAQSAALSPLQVARKWLSKFDFNHPRGGGMIAVVSRKRQAGAANLLSHATLLPYRVRSKCAYAQFANRCRHPSRGDR